ncbi:MAG: hypothetical protein MZV64_35035 [Ignavibacteriales bacterium]|nr:hypothetical protein [Ignavibacteriales bacterium]
MNYQKIVGQVVHDPRYKKYIEFGEPRSGHPEGKVSRHIVLLEEESGTLQNQIKRRKLLETKVHHSHS